MFVINISSISRAGNMGQSNYSAAKAGVAAMTVTWAKELARQNIRVAAIAPGFIETEMTQGMKPEALAKMTAGIPLKRMGKPDEIAHSAAFIFENDYWNSCQLDSDGDTIKKKLCKICETVGANWVKTSTGFGYVAQADGSMATMGATEHDIALMASNCSNKVEIKAAGGIKNFTTLLKMKDLGVTRIGTSSTRLILEECRESLNLDPLGQNIFKTTQGY